MLTRGLSSCGERKPFSSTRACRYFTDRGQRDQPRLDRLSVCRHREAFQIFDKPQPGQPFCEHHHPPARPAAREEPFFPPAQPRLQEANQKAQAADRGKGHSPSCQRREEDEARHLQKSNTALQQQREELQPEFIIPSENKGTDLQGKLTHRLHPSHLPLQAGNKFSK